MDTVETLCDITIFGGHGDLAFRKLMPALYHLSNSGYLDEKSRIITATRDPMSNDEHCDLVESKLKEFLPEGTFDEKKFAYFKAQLRVVTIEFDILESYNVHPQQGIAIMYPLGQEPIIGGGDRLGIICTAPAAVNCRAYAIFEE